MACQEFLQAGKEEKGYFWQRVALAKAVEWKVYGCSGILARLVCKVSQKQPCDSLWGNRLMEIVLARSTKPSSWLLLP